MDEAPVATDAYRASVPLCAARAALGGAYLVMSSHVCGSSTPETGRISPASVVVKILGARHLAQALITLALPSSTVLTAGAGADAAHCASMVVLGMRSRHWRGAAFADALIAASLAAGSAACAQRARHEPGGVSRP